MVDEIDNLWAFCEYFLFCWLHEDVQCNNDDEDKDVANF